MFVFISSHLLCYPGGGGWLHLWRGIEAAWWAAAAFSRDYRTISETPEHRLNHSTVCLISSLSQSIWMEPQTRDAQKRSWLLALLQMKNSSSTESTGERSALFPVLGEMQPKDAPDVKEFYQNTESTHLLVKGGRKDQDKLTGFWKVIPKSSG